MMRRQASWLHREGAAQAVPRKQDCRTGAQPWWRCFFSQKASLPNLRKCCRAHAALLNAALWCRPLRHSAPVLGVPRRGKQPPHRRVALGASALSAFSLLALDPAGASSLSAFGAGTGAALGAL